MKLLKKINVALLITATISCASSVYADSECEDIKYLANYPKIPAGSQVNIIVAPNSLGINGAAITAEAAGVVNGKVDGIQFVSIEAAAGQRQITVQFVNTAGAGTARYKPTLVNLDETFKTADITVYLGTLGCGGENTFCFDPSSPAAYRTALVRSVTHELFHSLGASDSLIKNIMYGMAGVNSVNNLATGYDCIFTKLAGFRNPTPPPCH